MRAYPINSPEAAARLLAVALVADGHYSMTELQSLDRLKVTAQLGLQPEAFKAVLDLFCEDLMANAHGQWTGQVDEATRSELLAEVQDPVLQDTVWRLCEAIALADGHLADGEAEMLDRLAFAWRSAPAGTA
jgi:uncharacterized tellurite resistance protein B-like protein